jgi:hypothetical protein
VKPQKKVRVPWADHVLKGREGRTGPTVKKTPKKPA